MMAANNRGKLRHGSTTTTTKLPPLQNCDIPTKTKFANKTVASHSIHLPISHRSTNNATFQHQQHRSKVHNPLSISMKTNKQNTSSSNVTENEKPELEIGVSGSPLSKTDAECNLGEGSNHKEEMQDDQTEPPLPEAKSFERRRMKDGKMSLVCELKLKTMRKEHNLLKQTVPPTDDVIEILRERAALDFGLVQSLKKKAITTRWDSIIDYVQENPQPGIFGLWEYLMARGGNEQLQHRLQETFNIFVNHHFDRDLQNLQLNKDRQNRVAKVMLDNMQKAEGYIDSLNLSIWEYQRYTEKISNLAKDDENSAEGAQERLSDSKTPEKQNSPSYIHVVYHKLENYVSKLEDENSENANEIEVLKIKLYEANAEIEKMQYESKRIRLDNQDKAKHIRSLQQEKQAVDKELEITKKKMTDVMNDKEGVNRKLDEMMSVMMKGMASLKDELKSDLKKEVSNVQNSVTNNMNQMETRMTARLDDVHETIEVLQEGQDDVRDGMAKIETRIAENMHSKKTKDKKVNLNINIKAPGIPDDNDDDLIKTRSDKLKNIQRK